jgi:hypothetical protein
MSNEAILKKAIEKANKNGGHFYSPLYFPKNGEVGNYEGLVFSHKFAKAFWGEKVIDDDFADAEGCSDTYVCDLHRGKMWEYHLQKMVLEENPLKYLEKFLGNK